MYIELTKEDWQYIIKRGSDLHLQHATNPNNTNRFEERKPFEFLRNDIAGAAAEFCFCKLHGIAWNEGAYEAPDFYKTEVRYTSGDTVKVKQAQDDCVVAAFSGGIKTGMTFLGWVFSEAAKQPEYLKDPGNRGYPNYFFPVKKLSKSPVPDHYVYEERAAILEHDGEMTKAQAEQSARQWLMTV